MKWILINDSRQVVESWLSLCDDDLIAYHHPAHVVEDIELKPEKFKDVRGILLDRMCYGEDLVEKNWHFKIKEMIGHVSNNEIKLVCASAGHVEGENLAGFDAVIDPVSRGLDEIECKLESLSK